MRISDWSSDVCSSDLRDALVAFGIKAQRPRRLGDIADQLRLDALKAFFDGRVVRLVPRRVDDIDLAQCLDAVARQRVGAAIGRIVVLAHRIAEFQILELLRSEEHTSELQSLMRISYAVFCLKKKTHEIQQTQENNITEKSSQQ